MFGRRTAFNQKFDLQSFDSSKNLITEKTDNDKFEIKKETENNFSSLLNDTNGFNKMLSELKEEKKQEDKDFEKQKEKNEYSNLLIPMIILIIIKA